MSNSIGFIESRGQVAAIAALDAMVKSANVKMLAVKETSAGLVSVSVVGDIGAVKTAVEAGAEVAHSVGEVVSTHVIAKPHAEVNVLLGIKK